MTTRALIEEMSWAALLERQSFTPEELALVKERLQREETQTRAKRREVEEEAARVEKAKQGVEEDIERIREFSQLYQTRVGEFHNLDLMNEALETERLALEAKWVNRPVPRLVTHGPEMAMQTPEFTRLMSIVEWSPLDEPLQFNGRCDEKDLFLSATLPDPKGKQQVWVEQFVPRELLL
jgi:hypothetical protein